MALPLNSRLREDPLALRFETYLLAERNVSVNTLEGYFADLAQFAASMWGVEAPPPFAWALINDVTARNFFRALAKDGATATTIRRKLAAVRTFYRFLRRDGGGWISSPVGMTRTAPSPAAPTPPLRFAFMSCQDYGGRWYNSLVPLLQEDLDFVLHLAPGLSGPASLWASTAAVGSIEVE